MNATWTEQDWHELREERAAIMEYLGGMKRKDAELTAAGYLTPAHVYAPQTGVDVSQVHRRGGDYVKSELAAAVDKPRITGDAIEHYIRYAPRWPAIAFCASVAHAEHTAAGFRAAGYTAASIDGSMTPYERRRESKALRTVRLAAWRVGLQATTADMETRHSETVKHAVQLGLIDGIDIAHALGGKTQLDAAAWWALTSGDE